MQQLLSGLQALGDKHVVNDADNFELVDVIGQGSFGTAELRRVSGSDGSSDGSFLVIKRVPLRIICEGHAGLVGLLLGEVRNGAAMHHKYIIQLFGAYISEKTRSLCLLLQ